VETLTPTFSNTRPPRITLISPPPASDSPSSACAASRSPRSGRRAERSEICWVDEIRTSTRPVAVNLNEVRATLASLVENRPALETRARAALEACRALPDG
jgi:hypothetical protein